MIDIVIPATLRPLILDRTLLSFSKYLFSDAEDIINHIYINIDPVGINDGTYEVVQTARKYFLEEKTDIFTPLNASFPKAFWRLFVNSTSDFVFYLEDDWLLCFPHCLHSMMDLMIKKPELGILRLPWKCTDEMSMKNWKWHFPWNGEYFECPEEIKRSVGFCGHPSLINGKFIRNAMKYLDVTKNPEKQFHRGHPELMKEVDRWKYGVYGKPNQKEAIIDIGRRWMVNNNLKKAGCKAFFTTWEKNNDA